MYQCTADTRTLVAAFAPGSPGATPRFAVAFTAFLGVNGTNLDTNDGVFYRDSKIKIADITDGTSNTLMVGERPPSSDMVWGWWFAGTGQVRSTPPSVNTGSIDVVLGVLELNTTYPPGPLPPGHPPCPRGPYEFGPGQLTNVCDSFHFWSLHSGGANFLLGDGSVKFLTHSAKSVMPALATRASGEPVTVP